MSVSCHKQTHAPQQAATLFDHRAGAGEQRTISGRLQRGALATKHSRLASLLAALDRFVASAPRNDAHSGMPAIRNACASLSMSPDRRKGARAFNTEIRWVGSIRIATAQACRAWSIRPAMA